MRGFLLSLAIVTAIGVAAPQSAATAAGGYSISAQPVYALALDQDKNITVDINTHSGRWYANPVWIAIGVLAAIIVLLLLVMIARGGGTTIIKE